MTGGSASAGFAWSIVFMIVSVLTIGGIVVGSIVRIVRRADAAPEPGA